MKRYLIPNILTDREFDVVIAYLNGHKRNTEIAPVVGLKENSVSMLMSSACKKLGVHKTQIAAKFEREVETPTGIGPQDLTTRGGILPEGVFD